MTDVLQTIIQAKKMHELARPILLNYVTTELLIGGVCAGWLLDYRAQYKNRDTQNLLTDVAICLQRATRFYREAKTEEHRTLNPFPYLRQVCASWSV